MRFAGTYAHEIHSGRWSDPSRPWQMEHNKKVKLKVELLLENGGQALQEMVLENCEVFHRRIV